MIPSDNSFNCSGLVVKHFFLPGGNVGDAKSALRITRRHQAPACSIGDCFVKLRPNGSSEGAPEIAKHTGGDALGDFFCTTDFYSWGDVIYYNSSQPPPPQLAHPRPSARPPRTLHPIIAFNMPRDTNSLSPPADDSESPRVRLPSARFGPNPTSGFAVDHKSSFIKRT